MEIINRIGYAIKSRINLCNISNKLCLLHGNSLQCHQLRSCAAKASQKSTTARKSSEGKSSNDLSTGPDLVDFVLGNFQKFNLIKQNSCEIIPSEEKHPYLANVYGPNQNVYFDIYGCQMNVNDAEIIWGILKAKNYKRTTNIEEADIILVITCSIRDSAEEKVLGRIRQLSGLKEKRKHMLSKVPVRIGLLGCMAERLKHKVLETHKMVDIVAGPDAYRDLPRLLSLVENNETAINVALSVDETYADITPVRLNPDAISAFVSIMRGCENMCTYCIVPFVRGKERSRPISSILDEIRQLSDQGIREVTLLGQNVNSYRDTSEMPFYPNEPTKTNLAAGFKTVYKPKHGGLRFSDLLDKVSQINPEMRIRFTSPHPKDFPDEVLHLIASRSNICNQIHLPAQSGNSLVLERMRRGYTREAYLELVYHIRNIIPNVKLSSDFIAGFCSETDDEFNDTLSLMEVVQYHMAYLFQYSMRAKTTAHRRFQDDVPAKIKLQRLQRMSSLFRHQAENLNRQEIGTHHLVLIEGPSRRSHQTLQGRTDGNTRVLLPKSSVPISRQSSISSPIKRGDYIVTQICDANSNSLTGIPLYHSTITDHSNVS